MINRDNPGVVHVILPVHNRKSTTSNYINCLMKQTHNNFHLIVVDDGSTDGTAQMITEKIPTATVIRGNGELWWAGALQKAYEFLKSSNACADDFVLISNDDTEFGECFIGNGISALKKHGKTLLQAIEVEKSSDAVSGGVYVDWRRFRFIIGTFEGGKINCLSTRNLLMTVKSFIDLGGFHPRLLPHYLSDYEFTIRAYDKGYQLKIDESFRSEHAGGIYEQPKLNWNNWISCFTLLFSKKNNTNPFYFSNFVILRCPWKYKAQCLVKVWLIFVYQTFFLKKQSRNSK